jgi:hypothetical protein
MTAAPSLPDFILNLLKNPQAQAEFRASPEHVLAANGLTGVSAADIRGTLPLVTDRRARMTGRRTMRAAASVTPITARTTTTARTPSTASTTLRSRTYISTCTESVAARINCPTGSRPPENDPLARRSGNAA